LIWLPKIEEFWVTLPTSYNNPEKQVKLEKMLPIFAAICRADKLIFDQLSGLANPLYLQGKLTLALGMLCDHQRVGPETAQKTKAISITARKPVTFSGNDATRQSNCHRRHRRATTRTEPPWVFGV
jgi:hypothetical protein